jgi:hypothetical protein
MAQANSNYVTKAVRAPITAANSKSSTKPDRASCTELKVDSAKAPSWPIRLNPHGVQGMAGRIA